MGIFEKIFGARQTHTPLEPGNPLAQHLDEIRQPLEGLAEQAKDSLEIVPSGNATYVFIGKPPKQFGIAWLQDGEVFNLKKIADQKGLEQAALEKTTTELSKAYQRSKEDERFATTVCTYPCLVTSSQTLAQDVDQIIQTISK